jgi:hypothetical protein
VAAALAALVLVLAAGCGRKSGTVPTSFAPVGQTGANNLLTVEMVLQPIDSVQTTPVVRLRVYDGTSADGYRIYRSVPGQGFDDLSRAPAQFQGSFDHGFEVYEAIDRDWTPNRGLVYLARGKVHGIETSAAPVTNVATLPPADSAQFLGPSALTVLCPPGTPSIPSKTDSTPVLKWQPIAGATRYLVRVERIDHRVFFYGFTPNDGSSFYQVGSGLGTVLQEKPLSLNSFFDWTVDAIDPDSRVVGRSSTHRIEVKPISDDSLVFCTP